MLHDCYHQEDYFGLLNRPPVGSFIGAMTGAVVGQATESGFFRGASIGAISGAVFSIEVYESSLLLWRSDVSGYWSLLYVIDIFKSLLSGRLVREKVGPAMLSAVQSQMSSFEANSGEMVDLFPIGGTRGLSADIVEMLPKIRITKTNNTNHSGEKILCSVCLHVSMKAIRYFTLMSHLYHKLFTIASYFRSLVQSQSCTILKNYTACHDLLLITASSHLHIISFILHGTWYRHTSSLRKLGELGL